MNITQPAFQSPVALNAAMAPPIAPDSADAKTVAASAPPSVVTPVPDSAEHKALVQLLAGQFAPALGLGMENIDGAATLAAPPAHVDNASTVDSLLKYLNVPGQGSAESIAQWIAENDRALLANMKNAVEDTLPASKNRDALQMGLEEDLKDWASQTPRAASASANGRMLGVVARMAEYELKAMPASVRMGAGFAAAPAAPALSAGTPANYGISLPELNTATPVRTDALSIKLAQDLSKLSDLAAQHHANTTPEVRQQVQDTWSAIHSAAKQLLAKNSNDSVASAILTDPIWNNRGSWVWALDRANPSRQISALGSTTTTVFSEYSRNIHLRDFQEQMASHISNLNTLNPTVFAKYGDPFIPLVEKAREARDEMATKLTTSPSDSMVLATLHQRQADFSVLAQALSSVIRNLQRITDNIINAMR